MPADAFLELGRFKEDLLRFMSPRRVAFVGGVAMRVWRARPGATKDYDLLVDRLKHYKEIHAFLEGAGATQSGSMGDTQIYYISRWMLEIDILFNDSPIFKAALDGAKPHLIKRIPVLVVRPVELAAMKVLAYHQRSHPRRKEQDRQDLVRLLTGENARVGEAEVVAVLKKAQPDLIPILRKVLARP